MTTETILTIVAIICLAFLVAAGDSFYRSLIDRRRTIQLYPSLEVMRVNMLNEAEWMVKWIHSCRTYEQICTVEDRMQAFADTYRDCEGFAGVMLDLYQFTEMAKKWVRSHEVVKPLDIRYSTE